MPEGLQEMVHDLDRWRAQEEAASMLRWKRQEEINIDNAKRFTSLTKALECTSKSLDRAVSFMKGAGVVLAGLWTLIEFIVPLVRGG